MIQCMNTAVCMLKRWRGYRQKTRKNSVKLGKNANNRLKIKEKAEILAQENCQKLGTQLKRGTLSPLICCITLPSTLPLFIFHDLFHSKPLVLPHQAWLILLLTHCKRTLYYRGAFSCHIIYNELLYLKSHTCCGIFTNVTHRWLMTFR